MPRRRHVPKSEASVIFVSLPAVEPCLEIVRNAERSFDTPLQYFQA